MKTNLETLIRIVGLPEPIKEFLFDPARKWRFDFAWPQILTALEQDGATWQNGRHNRGKGYEGDCEKCNRAQLLGWIVLRFTKDMIEDCRAQTALEELKRGLDLATDAIRFLSEHN